MWTLSAQPLRYPIRGNSPTPLTLWESATGSVLPFAIPPFVWLVSHSMLFKPLPDTSPLLEVDANQLQMRSITVKLLADLLCIRGVVPRVWVPPKPV